MGQGGKLPNGLAEADFESCRAMLLRVAGRALDPVLATRVSAEDLVQEAYSAVCRDTGSFMSNPDIPPYFKFRTALDQALRQAERRHLAAAKRDAYREVPIAEEGSEAAGAVYALPDPATSPRSRLAREERHSLLRHAMASLGDEDRAILELRHAEGLGNSECAAFLGITETAACQRHTRALQRLRERLQDYSEFRP